MQTKNMTRTAELIDSRKGNKEEEMGEKKKRLSGMGIRRMLGSSGEARRGFCRV